ncbi:MAG: cAMP-binding proteins - catabolite gene activator and regulatory subunit of cAMP-dependent protein kinases [uncultured Acetobacteraceae bacterium]|uniref:cAMP-binding proteins - catabolite gene activator and regulatory subunit of cAMP-dependent protein kinases n=1 Tax=uncultured Acetobacteraceae bacterium TaxID=169975 RepID=A0A6J4HZZ7_9PROT|nr:MAG: cAMP-binding proteins - catabolite gene activator and regulatory subunit of cAMP-dependent protein kinases [uncultured Acetobacteraceae bacterium]
MALIDQHNAAVRNGLLAALPLADLARLRPKLHLVELPFNQTLYSMDDTLDTVLFPESGMVSLLATLDDGEQIEVGIAGREGLVGLPLVFGDDRSLVEARVQMEGTALRIGAAAFRDEMEQSDALRTLLLRYALAFHAQITLSAACNARHAIEQRLARWLLIAHDRIEANDFPMTHEFISMMLGVRRPGVTIAAGILQKAGLIHYARGRMAVTDRPGLEAASCECYHTARREFARLLGAGAAQHSD